MSGIRVPLLCAFAGGCLSNAVLFGLWRATERADASQQWPQHGVEVAAPALASPRVEQASELAVADAVERARDTPNQPPPPEPTPDSDGAGLAPAGSAVSEVLTRLEAAYRERVTDRALPPPSPAPERNSVAAPTDEPPEPPRVVAASPVIDAGRAVPPAPAALEPVAPGAVAAVAPPALAPPVAAPPVAAPPVAAPAFAPPSDSGPSEIHYGDINQNTYITNIRQGDVYQIQLQQLAMLQYVQLLGASSGSLAPARQVVASAPHRGAFSSGITNPDNPWGFRFKPPNLVR